ncbi:MAG: DUF1992 domain-containing protein [Acidimicrobiia bacterium]|nr:DUF1992 domain-containing protein [Acidimicrobiia bacterium]
MSFEKIVEDQILKAIAGGAFDNLRGKGKALELESYFQTPESLRMAYSMLKSAEFVPEEIRLMQEIGAAKEALSSCRDANLAAQLERDIRDKELRLSVLLERQRRREK